MIGNTDTNLSLEADINSCLMRANSTFFALKYLSGCFQLICTWMGLPVFVFFFFEREKDELIKGNMK
jgi:hypothetical protein